MNNSTSIFRFKQCLFGLLIFTISMTGCQQKTTTLDLKIIKKDADSHTAAMTQFLSELITYQSIEQAGEPLLPVTKNLIDKVLTKGKEFGFTTRKAAGGMVGILEYGEGEETVGVIAHLDVVSAGDLSQWTHPPFAGKVIDQVIWGRGAQDDKAGVVGSIWGAKILIDNKATFHRKLRIILVTKEETGFGAITRYLQEEEPPTFGIVPDGLFIIRAENGYLDAKYSFSNPEEPNPSSTTEFVHWQGGSAVNAIPDSSIMVLKTHSTEETLTTLQQSIIQAKAEHPPTEGSTCTEEDTSQERVRPCQAQVSAYLYSEYIRANPDTLDVDHIAGDLVLVAKGVTGHSSTPEKGRNAIVDLAQVASKLNAKPNAIKNAIDFASQGIGQKTDGSNFSLKTEKSIPEAADTTACLSLISPTDNGIELNINYRTGVANTNEEILQKSGKRVATFFGRVEASKPMFDAYYFEDDDPLLNAAKISYRAVTGEEAPLIPIAATTQVKAAANLVAFGPVDAEQDGTYFHAVNERIPVKSLTRNAALYAHMLQQMIQSPEPLVRE